MMAGYCSSLIPYAIAVVLINIKGRNTQIRSFLNMFILFGLATMVITAISKSGFLGMVVGILFTLAFTLNKLTIKQRICTSNSTMDTIQNIPSKMGACIVS